MRAPKKLYIVVSRSRESPLGGVHTCWVSAKAAMAVARHRNEEPRDDGGIADWRVETYVKGD